jgi:hypothetical protein
MTEFEAFEALRIEAAFALSVGEQSITLLSGYLLIAFFIGSKLTFFQASFVNVVFSMMYLSSSLAIIQSMPVLNHLAERLNATGSEIPLNASGANPAISITITSLMYLGAMYFMWSVRHPKVE